jgi:hypothetical protein
MDVTSNFNHCYKLMKFTLHSYVVAAGMKLLQFEKNDPAHIPEAFLAMMKDGKKRLFWTKLHLRL